MFKAALQLQQRLPKPVLTVRVGVQLGVPDQRQAEEIEVTEPPQLLPVQLIVAQSQRPQDGEPGQAVETLDL